jgi:hypothetical protein
MPELTREQEQKIVEALIALDWTEDQDADSRAVITQLLNCSADEAKATLEYIYVERKLIKAISSSTGELDARKPMPVGRWKWLAT